MKEKIATNQKDQTIYLNEKIFDFAFNEALNDATRRTKAAGCKNDALKARNIIKVYADSILNGEAPDFYKTEKNVEEKIGNANFNFGNAQKLINMTMKYLYIACYKNMNLRVRFDNCHCPMDRTMKDKVVSEYRKAIRNGEAPKENSIFIDGQGKESTNWSDVSWSKIKLSDIENNERNEYASYQKMVSYLSGKKKISPLEYDFVKFTEDN